MTDNKSSTKLKDLFNLFSHLDVNKEPLCEDYTFEKIQDVLKHKRDMSKIYTWTEKIYETDKSLIMRGKQSNGTTVIGKFLNGVIYKQKHKEHYIYSEIFIHKQLLKENTIGIVNLLDFYLDTEGRVVIVEPELVPCEPKSEEEIRQYFKELLISIYCMHQHGYIHHDIKCENILLNPQNKTVNIIDFGFTTNKNEYSCNHDDFIPGTPGYRPDDEECSTAFDIYCCGSVLEKWYKDANIEMDIKAKKLLKKLKDWQRCRPNASEALNHPYIRNDQAK